MTDLGSRAALKAIFETGDALNQGAFVDLIDSLAVNGAVVPESLRDQPNGFVGINASGLIIGTFGSRVDTAANLASIVLKTGETAYASDTRDTFRGDDATPGGLFVSGGKFVAYVNGTSVDAAQTAILTVPVRTNGVYTFNAIGDFVDSTTTSNYSYMLDHVASGGFAAIGPGPTLNRGGKAITKWGHTSSKTAAAASILEYAHMLAANLTPSAPIYMSCPATNRGDQNSAIGGVLRSGGNGNLIFGLRTRTAAGTIDFAMMYVVERIA